MVEVRIFFIHENKIMPILLTEMKFYSQLAGETDVLITHALIDALGSWPLQQPMQIPRLLSSRQ